MGHAFTLYLEAVMFENMKLRGRILIGYSIPLLLSVIMAALIYGNVDTLETLEDEGIVIHEIYDSAKELSFMAAKSQRAVRGYLLNPNDVSLKNFTDTKKQAELQVKALMVTVKCEEGLKILRKMELQIGELYDREQLLISLAKEGKQAKAVEEFIKGKNQEHSLDLERLTREFEKHVESHHLAEIAKKNHEAFDAIKRLLVVGSILSVIAAVVIGILIASRISAPIAKTAGDISATSNQIAATLAQHERTASNQSAMVSETATTVEELGASSRITAQQAETAAETARKAGAMTSQGKEVVEQAATAMDGLKDKVGEIAAQILRLAEQTTRINSIANLVKDLAGEINMLALNASVEAVRAGESGKGFAVVAGEVRKLADQSKKSAEQASLIVSDIQKAASSTIMITEDGTKRVEVVREHARKVSEIFDSIASSASGVYDNTQQVLLNTRQQMAAVGQVVEAINGINTGARETAAGISQTKTGVEQLNKAAQSLKKMT